MAMTCKQCGLEKQAAGAIARQVATTIKRQIGIRTLMEMGAHQFRYIGGGGAIRGGLGFNIKYRSNRRGYVSIELTARDTYDIDMKDFRRKTIVSHPNVYADQLSRVLRYGFKKLRGE